MRRRLSGLLLLLVGAVGLAAESDPSARFAAVRPKLGSRDKAERQEAYEAYLREGPEGRKRLAEELLAVRSAAAGACREFYLASATQEKLLTGHKKLTDARQEALRVIFDKKIYPDADHGRVGQPVVDRAVEAVKAAYPLHRTGFVPVVRRFEKVARAYERIKEIDEPLAKCDVKDVELNPPLEKLVSSELKPELIKVLLELCELYGLCDRVARYNRLIRTTAAESERKVVDLTNEYRMQLGIRPLAISEPLMQAARKHSQEMARLHYFAHESPTPENRSPTQRCQNEGYKGFAGENCCTGGSAEGAFKGWYNSSGHHRNMLGPKHNEIGVGFGGPWTEDFGCRRDLDLDNPPQTAKPPPPKEPGKKK
jgi:uncharacterized protein YkwD